MKKINMLRTLLLIIIISAMPAGCGKKSDSPPEPPAPTPDAFVLKTISVNNQVGGILYYDIGFTPTIKVSFSSRIDKASVAANVTLLSANGNVPVNASYENNDSTLVLQPASALKALTKYKLQLSTALQSQQQQKLSAVQSQEFITSIDSTDKFPRITDDQLLDLVQKQTFKYFWDFAHSVSGMARERNSSGDIVTSGGTGFGIMAIPVAVSRNFITRAQALARMQTIVGFLKTKAQTFHGAFPHWLNGATGVVIPFSTKDNGADLVETSYLFAGLLCARQYFNGVDAAETTLRTDINSLWAAVEWNWFRQNNQNVLYWHWSPNFNWEMNHAIRGWNECLITYVLAASSSTFGIPKSVYDNGWASNGGMANGKTYYGYQLPLGPELGGPLFFAHYSFLGINPNGLTDAYADYLKQNKNHALINYNYCKTNPKGNFGYSDACWGLTASDINNGYTASSPTNDVGVIAPTAALASFPYTPTESMKALQFFYYKLGDKLWGEYGFYDSFSLKDLWFANSTLAIDQGPIIVMIENYRTGLLWNLFMSCPEIKTGMQNLGFISPYF
jgi:hypothetical protein